MMALNPLGGVQYVQIPYRPPVAIGEGSIVRFSDGQFAEVYGAALERRRGAWGLFLRVMPVSTGAMLTGFGETRDYIDVEEIA